MHNAAEQNGDGTDEEDGSEAAKSDTEDDEAAGESHGDQTEEDEAEDIARPRSISSRLPKKPVFEANNASRTIESLREQVDEIAASIAAAQAQHASLAQPAALTATLRGYQLEGFRWAVALESCGHNGILGDEMGLGKTLQAIALFAHLHSAAAGSAGAGAARFLVLAPLSTLAGWGAQLADFCPSATVVLYSGGAAEREARRRALLAPLRAGAFEVCLASYEVCDSTLCTLCTLCRETATCRRTVTETVSKAALNSATETMPSSISSAASVAAASMGTKGANSAKLPSPSRGIGAWLGSG